MKSQKILRGLIIAVIALACIIIFPNAVNAAGETYTRRIVGNDGSIELTVTGLTLDVNKQYQYALTTSVGATDTTTWHTIANITTTTAIVNLSAGTNDVRDVLKVTDEGYLYIKASDVTDGTYVLTKFPVNLKLPYLQAINYEKVGGWYQINQLYGAIGQGNSTLSRGTYYQFKKVTDRNIIQTYLQNKSNITALENLIGTYPTSGYTQNGHINPQDYNDGLYILWIEQVGTDCKAVHGAIIHDGKPTATTVDEYLGTSASPSPSPSTSPSPSPTPNGTWADISKMKVELEQNMFNFTLHISGISLVRGHKYSVYVTKNKMTKPSLSSTGIPTNYNTELTPDGETKINVNEELELNGDTYLYIYESYYEGNSTNQKGDFIVKDYVINRPEIKLGSRIKCYFFGGTSGYTSTYINTPHDSNIDRKLKLKIGRVTDNNILRSIQKGESDCLVKLLDYAKKADKDIIYEGTVPVGKSKNIADNLNLINEAYYYVYMVAEDEGKYYPVEDVSLYQGVVGETVGKNLFDYLSDDFKWNLGDDPAPTNKPDNTTMNGKLPKTGQTILTLVVVVAIAGAGVIFYIKAKEYKV